MARIEHKRAWTAKSEADGAVIEIVEAARRVADSQGTLDAAAAARAAEATRGASASFGKAADAFKRSSRLTGSAAGEYEKAGASFRMDGDRGQAMLAADRASKSRVQSVREARTAVVAERGAGALARDADDLADGASRRAASKCKRSGDGRAMEAARADMGEDAGQERAMSAAMLDRAVDAAGAAAQVRKLAAGAASNSAEAAAGVHGSQDVQGAMAEWREAAAAANAADSEDGDRCGGGRQGQRRRQQRRRM